MLESHAAVHKAFRDFVFDSAPAGMKFSFDSGTALDVGTSNSGPLFQQNDPFFLFELGVGRTGRAGPGKTSPRRGWGTLIISYLTKDSFADIEALEALEEVADWFGDQTVDGIRFRQFTPVGDSSFRGFRSFDGSIACDFELRPLTR